MRLENGQRFIGVCGDVYIDLRYFHTKDMRNTWSFAIYTASIPSHKLVEVDGDFQTPAHWSIARVMQEVLVWVTDENPHVIWLCDVTFDEIANMLFYRPDSELEYDQYAVLVLEEDDMRTIASRIDARTCS